MNLSHTPRHLSVSSINQYLHCPAEYYWNRVEGIRLLPSVVMAFGSAVHLGLRAYHLGHDPFDAFTEAWWFAEEELQTRGLAVSPQYTDWGIALLKLYRRDPLQGGVPEVRWEVNVDGLAVPLVGYYDLQGDGWIGEHKTSGWPWKSERVAQEFQAALYAAVYPLVAGRPLEHLTYTVLSCSPEPTLTRTVLAPDLERDTRTFETCRVVLASMQAGIWTPRCPPSQCRYPAPEFCPLLRAVQERGTAAPGVESDREEVPSGV